MDIYQGDRHIDTAFWNELDIATLTASDHNNKAGHGKAGYLGVILLASCPGLGEHTRARDDDMKRDIARLAAAGVSLVLTLLEADDRVRLGVSALDEIISDAGLADASFPIRDHGAPHSDQSAELHLLLDDLEARIRNGQSIAIHCQAGLGRTGMMAGILLSRFGIDGAAAITAIRQARPGSIETSAQEDFVTGWV